ncbi:Leucine-rich repeat extensin-like protein [Melia azedarach]|uniref:Leucine-rich repeat extensin-like protein n=1 Tax=Melia azedarach TaxID=155640 RepID=A0ACC1Z207_MELAZ|nr:Leucine-rich repeat extensin-like protein [Melia azedarach]
MASFMFSTNISNAILIILFLHLQFLSNNLAAKHSYSSTHHHHHRLHNSSPFANPKLHQAYVALQAWKRVIYSDPNNFTANWVGPSVCNYKGIYCASPPYDHKIQVVAGIDLNHADIAGFLPGELGLLSDLALIHVNSNRFCGIIPQTLSNLTLLYELDLSNNRFVGPFPRVVLSLPMLNYLDLRFNEFEGPLPPELFNKKLDAIFVNDNRLTNMIPQNFGANNSATVLVIANNKFGGCLPPSIANLANSLEELLLINTSLSGCLPPEVGYLYKLRVLDVSFNKLVGPIPYSIAGLAHLEQLNLAHNMMTGIVPEGVCMLPNLANFTFSYNFFCEEEGICRNLTSKGIAFDDRRNCLPEKPLQRSNKVCEPVLEHPVECFEQHCSNGGGTGMVPTAMLTAAPVISPSIAPAYR